MKKYLINGFEFMYHSFRKNIKEYSFEYLFPKSQKFDCLTNFLLYRKNRKNGMVKQYDIVHINNWENFLQHKKVPGQLSIAESHGFHLGFNFKQILQYKPMHTKLLSIIINLFLTRHMQKQIKTQFDIYYVSTPDLLEDAKKIRKDAIWLPNPIDTFLFSPDGEKVKLVGTPAVFFPTRFHAMKNPELGIRIFKIIQKEFPDARLHLVKYRADNDPLFDGILKKHPSIKECIVLHNYMSAERFACYLRAADLVIGQFAVGACGLVELQTMACKTPLVTYDRYELKTNLKELPGLALRLLCDQEFKEKFVQKNLDYVKKVHCEKKVTEVHLKNLKRISSDLA